MNYQDDHRLLDDLRSRNPEAFRWVFERYADKIYRLAVSILEHESEADEVVQDAFLKLFEHLDRFEGRSKIGTWLYRVAYNRCQDQLRLRQRDQIWLVGDGPHTTDLEQDISPTILIDWTQSPEAVLDEKEKEKLLYDLIQSLPATLRMVFLLRDVEGLSTADCALSLDITESACKVRLHRARLQLREKLSSFLAERLEGEAN